MAVNNPDSNPGGNLRPTLDFLFKKVGFEHITILTDGIHRPTVESLVRDTVIGTHRFFSSDRASNRTGVIELPPLPAIRKLGPEHFAFKMTGLFNGMTPDEVMRMLREGPFNSRFVDRTIQRVGPKLQTREWQVVAKGPQVSVEVSHFHKQWGSAMDLEFHVPEIAGLWFKETAIDYNEVQSRKN